MKNYAFHVCCSFNMTFTFTEREVEPADGGDIGDLEPTSEALLDLQNELEEHLRQNYDADEVDAFAEYDDLLDAFGDNGKELPFASLPPVLRERNPKSANTGMARAETAIPIPKKKSRVGAPPSIQLPTKKRLTAQRPTE